MKIPMRSAHPGANRWILPGAYDLSAVFRPWAMVTFIALSQAIWLPAQPRITAVLNAASYEPLVAPGSLVAVFGANLASVTSSTVSLPLPTSLEGISVRVGSLAARVYSVSPSQLNIQLPFELTGDTATLTV